MATRPSKSTGNASSNQGTITTLATVLANIGSSVAIIMVNKYVLTHGFPYASTLTALHQLSGWMFTTSFSVAGILSTSNPSEATALRASEGLKVGVAYAGGLVLMNQSLLINPVAVYQLLKMACIPTIAIIQSYYGVRLSRLSVFSLGLILLGVSVSTFLPKGSSGGTVGKSVDVSLLGLLYGFLGVLATSAGQVWMQTRPTIRSLSGLQTIAVISPYAFAVCAASALIADLDWSTVSFRAVSEAAHWQEMWTQITKWLFEIPSNIPLVAVLTSCALSVVTNLFGFVLIQRVRGFFVRKLSTLRSKGRCTHQILMKLFLFPILEDVRNHLPSGRPFQNRLNRHSGGLLLPISGSERCADVVWNHRHAHWNCALQFLEALIAKEIQNTCLFSQRFPVLT